VTFEDLGNKTRLTVHQTYSIKIDSTRGLDRDGPKHWSISPNSWRHSETKNLIPDPSHSEKGDRTAKEKNHGISS
jgi:hypothetical protein